MIKFRRFDYDTHKLYVLQIHTYRFSLSISANYRRYTLTYGRMLDDVLYSIDWFKSVEL